MATNNEKFDDFQLEEYKNISNAHFETINQISSFFRYYLIILAAPAAVIVVLDSDKRTFEELFNFCLPQIYYYGLGSFFLVLAFVGLLFCWYVINLRHDAILYARSINAVRNYFYNQTDLKIGEQNS